MPRKMAQLQREILYFWAISFWGGISGIMARTEPGNNLGINIKDNLSALIS